jgi:hypothetical protein
VTEYNADKALLRVIPASTAMHLQLVSDASERGYGAVLQGEPQTQMAFPMSAEERAAMQGEGLSSTLREVKGFIRGVQELHRLGRVQKGAAVQIWTDSQSAYACCARMRGHGEVFEAVKTLHLLAWEMGLELSFVWVPREHEVLQAADLLSKSIDPGDWRFSRKFAAQQVFSKLGTPDLDCLGSAWAHMCPVYFSEMFDGKCCAVDGFQQRWDAWPSRGGDQPAARRGGKPLCWLFPPLSRLHATLVKIETDRAEAIVVLPRTLDVACETVLKRLPVRQQVDVSGPHSVMVVATVRVPAQVAAGGWKTPLRACRVAWS